MHVYSSTQSRILAFKFPSSITDIDLVMAELSQQPGRPLPVLFISTLIPIALTLILHPLIPVFGLTEYFPFPPQPTFPALQANVGFSILALVGALLVIPKVTPAFLAKGIKGRDLLKPGGRTSGPWV